MLLSRQQRESSKAASLAASGGGTIDLALLQMGVDVLQVSRIRCV